LTSNGTTWVSSAGSSVSAATPTALGTVYGKTNTANPKETFLGYQAGNVTTGNLNTFIGFQAGIVNTSGGENVVVGADSFKLNISGAGNAVLGYGAMSSNTSGSYNVAIAGALGANQTGGANVGIGQSALGQCTSGNNTGVGRSALSAVSSGSNNTSLGFSAGNTVSTGSDNIYVGYNTTASSSSVSTEIVVGVSITGKGTNTAFIGGTSGAYNGANTTTWTTTSDQRIQKNIVNLENGLSIITALRPVEFDYKENNRHEIGFIAQEYETFLPNQIVKHAANESQKEMIGGEEVLGIQQNLVPYLVKALQELNAKFEAYVAAHP